MKCQLLDTCTFVWLASDPSKLGGAATRALRDGSVARRLSMASVWEIALKHAVGKLPLPRAPRYWVEEQTRLQNIGIVPLEREVIYRSCELPAFHRDPFDRLIAAEALLNKWPVLSPDPPFAAYGCKILWA